MKVKIYIDKVDMGMLKLLIQLNKMLDILRYTYCFCFIPFCLFNCDFPILEDGVWFDSFPQELICSEKKETLLLTEFNALNQNTYANSPVFNSVPEPQFHALVWESGLPVNRETFSIPFHGGSPSELVIKQFGAFSEANFSNPVDPIELEMRLQNLSFEQFQNIFFVAYPIFIVAGGILAYSLLSFASNVPV